MKLLLKGLVISMIILNVLGNSVVLNAKSNQEIGSLSDLKEIVYSEEVKVSQEVKTEYTTPQQETKTVTPEVLEGPKGDIFGKGQCGAVSNTSIYDFDNGGDSLNTNSRGLCNIGAIPQSFVFNTTTHTRNWLCAGTSGGKKPIISQCKAQESFCGDGIENMMSHDSNPWLVSKNWKTNIMGEIYSTSPKTSSDGRYVVFESSASNLVDGDTNGKYDIFLYDNQKKSLINITKGANNNSLSPSISKDGKFITFHSDATNLVEGDTGTEKEIYLYNTSLGSLQKITKNGNNPSFVSFVSDNGKYIVFQSSAYNLVEGDTNGQIDIFLYDIDLKGVINISNGGNNISYGPSITPDGRFITFQSAASNLVDGDVNGKYDNFLYDNQKKSLINFTKDGNGHSFNTSIGGDGRFITFQSAASNLVDGDTNGKEDIFIYDTLTKKFVNITKAGNKDSKSPNMSADGRFISFQSAASNLVDGDTNGKEDIFIYDTLTLSLRKITAGTFNSQVPSISAYGTVVSFVSDNQVYMMTLDSREQCDDGNDNPNDGCNVQCTIVPLP